MVLSDSVSSEMIISSFPHFFIGFKLFKYRHFIFKNEMFFGKKKIQNWSNLHESCGIG